LYNILIEFGIPIKLVTLIKIYLNKIYCTIHTGQHLPDAFPTQNGLKQEDALWLLLFNFTSEYTIKKA